MSHIILQAKIEEIRRLFVSKAFTGRNCILILKQNEGFDLPVIIAQSDEGVILRVENGDQHINSEPIQEVLAHVASEIREALGCKVVRATVLRRLLKKYDLLDA